MEAVQVSPRPGAPRHWWLAGILSLLLPGLGQLYAGHWRRAVGFFIVNALIDFPFLLGLWSYAALLDRPGGFWLAATVGIGVVLFRIVAIVDAAFVASHTPRGLLAPYQRWYLYVAILFAWNAPGLAGMSYPDSGTESYSIPGGSMIPTLQIGDYVIGIQLSGTNDLPKRGAIVTHIDAASGDTYIRRLIGLPGDTVEMRDGRLILNGMPVAAEPVGTFRGAGGSGPMLQETLPQGTRYNVLDVQNGSALDTVPAATVPPGYVFLLGDNRDNSRDSRVNGPVPIESLEAIILYVYWSSDLGRIGLRLD